MRSDTRPSPVLVDVQRLVQLQALYHHRGAAASKKVLACLLVHVKVPTDDELPGISRADFISEHFIRGS